MDESKYGFWFPPDVSTHGVQIDQLIDIVHWFMLILFVGWGIFFVYCLIKYRARPGHAAAYLPPKAQFTKVIEGAVIVVEVLLLFGFSTPVWFKYKNHPPAEKDAVVVKLVAEQFKLRSCDLEIIDGKSALTRPCLYYDMHACLGPCVSGLTTKAAYDDAALQLRG